MEALSFGIPILSFPDKEHREQENNAKMIGEKGYGMMLSYSTPPEAILECIREVLEEDKYRNNTQRLCRLARELKGPNAIRKLIEEEINENIC